MPVSNNSGGTPNQRRILTAKEGPPSRQRAVRASVGHERACNSRAAPVAFKYPQNAHEKSGSPAAAIDVEQIDLLAISCGARGNKIGDCMLRLSEIVIQWTASI